MATQDSMCSNEMHPPHQRSSSVRRMTSIPFPLPLSRYWSPVLGIDKVSKLKLQVWSVLESTLSLARAENDLGQNVDHLIIYDYFFPQQKRHDPLSGGELRQCVPNLSHDNRPSVLMPVSQHCAAEFPEWSVKGAERVCSPCSLTGSDISSLPLCYTSNRAGVSTWPPQMRLMKLKC